MQPGKLRGIGRLADERGHFRMLAIDQRPPLIDLVTRAGSTDVDGDVTRLKALAVECLQANSSAVLIDPPVAMRVFADFDPRRGLMLTLEDHRFGETADGRTSAAIPEWSVERIKRAGADGVKLLAWFRPDVSPGVRDHQERFVEEVGAACALHDIPFVLELLTYPLLGSSGTPARPGDRADAVLKSVDHFAAPRFGVDVFKVESPFAATDLPPLDDDDGTHRAVFDELDRVIGRPWVLLSGGSDRDAFTRALEYACAAGASGFLAGRSIWWHAVSRYPDLAAVERDLRGDAVGVMMQLETLVADRALSWRTRAGRLSGEDGDTSDRRGSEC